MMPGGHFGADLTPSPGVIARLVRVIERSGAVGRASVEQATGRGLHIRGDDGYFRSYGAEPRREGKRSYSIELREPKPKGGAAGGATLIVRVSGSCVSKTALSERYHGLRLTDVPRGRSPDEQAYWTRSEPWGELSFGFSNSDPSCLKSVVFRAASPSRAEGL